MSTAQGWSCSDAASPLAPLYAFYMLEEKGVGRSKRGQGPARDSLSLFGSKCLQQTLSPTSAGWKMVHVYWSVLVCLIKGKIIAGEFILLSSWRQSPSQAPYAAFSSVPSSQGLVSHKKGESHESCFPAEGCKLPREPGYSNSPTGQTQRLLRGDKLHRKHQT